MEREDRESTVIRTGSGVLDYWTCTEAFGPCGGFGNLFKITEYFIIPGQDGGNPPVEYLGVLRQRSAAERGTAETTDIQGAGRRHVFVCERL